MDERFKPFRIGGVEIDFPVVLAAVAGYSDLPYRLICRRFGAPYCATEMMLDRLVLMSGKLRNRMAALAPEDHPIAGQITGNEPPVMAAAGAELCRMGFDVVDLNFACPVRKALSRRRGGYMMSQPEQVLEIVRAVLSAVDRPVTLKIRRGFKEEDSRYDDFWRIAEGAFRAGVAAITVHARSVQAMYRGPASWDFLAEVRRRFPDQTIIGSGDVHKPADALRMIEATGLTAAAVARGALGNPWFFRQARDLAAGREPYQPSASEQRAVLEGHFEHALRLYGPQKAPKIMRKFGIRYARLHGQPKKVRMAFVSVNSREQWQTVLDTFYGLQ